MKKYIRCEACKKIMLIDENQDLCGNCKANLSLQNLTPIKALSIRQPWAWLIVNGFKDVENRDTLKNFRGDFLIHASLQFDKNYSNKLDFNIHLKKHMNKLQYGGIIGAGTIIDCVTSSNSEWFMGKYGFIITNPIELEFQACKGKLSFFNPEIF